MINSLGAGYQFMGVAKLTPTPTDPGAPDQNVFYVAFQPGIYGNFGSQSVADGEIAILKWNGSWTKEVTGAASAAKLDELGHKVDGIDSEGYSGFDDKILITDDNEQEVIVEIDESGLKAKALKYADGDGFSDVKEEIDGIKEKLPTTEATQEIKDSIRFEDDASNYVASVEDDGVHSVAFIPAGVSAYNDVIKNKAILETAIGILKNKLVDDTNRCVVSFNGDSILGSQLDDITQSPEYNTGAFPPNMSKMIVARKFYDAFKFSGEDTQFRNISHSDWVKNGFNKSQKYKPTATEPYTASDLLTFNEIETYGCNSGSDSAQIQVSGYRFYKLIWSECSYSGWQLDVLVSIDGGGFASPSSAGLTGIPDRITRGTIGQSSNCMVKYAICELDPTKTYIFKVVPYSTPTNITFWGCEFWNNKRLDVVVEAYSGTTAKKTYAHGQDAYYSEWHKPAMIITDILAINDTSYYNDGAELLDEWMSCNAALLELAKQNGIPVLAFRAHANALLNTICASFAQMFNVAFIDIRKKLEVTGTQMSDIVNSVDGLHLNNAGESFYFAELERLFDN